MSSSALPIPRGSGPRVTSPAGCTTKLCWATTSASWASTPGSSMTASIPSRAPCGGPAVASGPTGRSVISSTTRTWRRASGPRSRAATRPGRASPARRIPRIPRSASRTERRSSTSPLLQAYAFGSRIFGEYGEPWELGGGANWFPFETKVFRVNADLVYVRESPVGYLSFPLVVGANGPVFMTNLELFF